MPNLSAARVGILKNPLAIIGGLGLATAADPARCGDRRWRSFANGTRISVDPCPRRGRLYGASRGSTRIIGGFWIYAGVLEYLQRFLLGRYWLSPWSAVRRDRRPPIASPFRLDRSLIVEES